MLSLLLNPDAKPREDPRTQQPVTSPKKRADYLLACIQKEKGKIVVPTPAVAEILTVIGPEAQAYFDIIAQNRLFEVAAFDSRAAIELAFLNRDVFATTDRKNKVEAYQKVKVDRQILAVLKSRGVTEIYTDDVGLSNRARLCGITPVGIAELPLPPDEQQMKLEFEGHDEIPQAEQPENMSEPEAS
jgi:predicted nucleic acid-binding protein